MVYIPDAFISPRPRPPPLKTKVGAEDAAEASLAFLLLRWFGPRLGWKQQSESEKVFSASPSLQPVLKVQIFQVSSDDEKLFSRHQMF